MIKIFPYDMIYDIKYCIPIIYLIKTTIFDIDQDLSIEELVHYAREDVVDLVENTYLEV